MDGVCAQTCFIYREDILEGEERDIFLLLAEVNQTNDAITEAVEMTEIAADEVQHEHYQSTLIKIKGFFFYC